MKKYISHNTLDYMLHMVLFGMAFIVLGYYIPKIYYAYFDKKVYYEITNPVIVEQKINHQCNYVDAYIHRKVLAPMKGNSVRQLTLIRENDGLKQRIRSFSTDIQADIGEATMVVHWQLPCDIPVGTYFFEGTVEYKVFENTKYTHFFTENFIVKEATPSSKLNSP